MAKLEGDLGRSDRGQGQGQKTDGKNLKRFLHHHYLLSVED
jgi:hypothetical protein